MSQRSGVLTTANQSTEGRAVRDVSPVINQLEPSKYPLVVILTNAEGRKKVTGNYKFEWIEDSLKPRYDSLTADLTSSASSMTVSDYTKFIKNMLVRVNKSEIVRVTATPTSTTVSISRAVGETSAAAASNGNQLHIIGIAMEDGAAIGDILTTIKSNPYNFTQIFEEVIGWTIRAMNSEVYGQSDKEYDRAKAIIEHAKDIENAFIMGERYEVASGGVDSKRLTTTRGVATHISTNVTSVPGTMTEATFDEIGRKGFRYGSPKKLGLFSSKVSQVVNGFGKQRVELQPASKEYGLALTRYLLSGGKVIDFVDHPLLENNLLTDLTGLAGTGYIIDVGDLQLRHMANCYMVHKLDVVKDGSNQEKEKIYSDCGLQLEQEKKHSEFSGVTD